MTGEAMSDVVPVPRQLVVFSLGEEEYGLPIGSVQEIIRYTEPRGVVSAVASVAGVISLRGKIIAVHDLAVRLGIARGVDGVIGRKIIILERDGEPVGLVVDDVEEVLTVGPDDLDSPPESSDPAVEAIARVGERLVVLLDPAAVLGRERAAA